jgi:glycosyltransferase involved in cell wall biosynthesis
MTMRNPVVSVCVPTYNGGAFLDQTLKSIAAQTFEDYEVIIVDDNSTDDSVALARQYATSDPRVKLFEPSQRAGSSARNANRCLAHARGEWIKFLFQDDVMAPHCLSSMLDATRDGRRFALSWHDYLFEPGVDAGTRASYEALPALRTVLPGTYATPEQFCEALLANWGKNFLGPTSSSFIHRECFKRYGEFSSDIVTLPDLECWIRMGINEGLAIAPAYLVTFRVHATSISGGLRNNRLRAYRNPLERILICLDLASAPEYASMRKYLQSRSPALTPKQMLVKNAKSARWRALDVKRRYDDPSLLEQWESFARGHPQIVELLREADMEQPGLMKRVKSFLSFGLTH